MSRIDVVARVMEDGTLSVPPVPVPDDLPPGMYRVAIVIDRTPEETARRIGLSPLTTPSEDAKERLSLEIPVHDSRPWSEGLSLRR